MSRTGLEDAYIMRGSKKLRMGYTTGSCAAAAARGAAFMLLSGKEIQEVKIQRALFSIWICWISGDVPKK